ncbi:MAG: hypothetical protein KDD69_09255, partial [Bdellovibrionales bacterium]|nr:hypothetical protein [Bdellovibrionales bacterium]
MKNDPLERICRRYGDALSRLPVEHVPHALILSSALALFSELAVIRLHGAYLPVLALLKNISLLSAFLGLGAGFVVADRRPAIFPLFAPLLLSHLVMLRFMQESGLYARLANPIAEESMMGVATGSGLTVAVSVVFIAVVFFWNALVFLPLGQLIGSLMIRLPNVRGYSYNLIGSALGVGLFSLSGLLWLGGGVWLAITALAALPFLLFSRQLFWWGILFLAAAIAVVEVPFDVNRRTIFSPYQSIDLAQARGGALLLSSNGLYYQRLLDLRDEKVASDAPTVLQQRRHYDLPYTVGPDSPSVLVLGSGTGNDVAAALRNGARSVTAVEIDPVIAIVGERLHPEAPYQSERVELIATDARAFMKRAGERRYDLIVYGLLDSHALLSGRAGGGIRLDSYVYTVEALRSARELLAPGGVLVLSFAILEKRLSAKFEKMLEEAFDGAPVRIIRTGYDEGVTFFAAERGTELPSQTAEAIEIDAAEVDVSTDDWPFLYMPKRTYPMSYLLLWVPLLLGSFVLLNRLSSLGERRPFHWPAFFLGAAFMLL